MVGKRKEKRCELCGQIGAHFCTLRRLRLKMLREALRTLQGAEMLLWT